MAGYPPCKNPSCRSYGKPHPNCRCYAEMAEGGEASFCMEDRKHQPDCEYFQDGGDVGADFIPDDQVPEEDAPAPEVQPQVKDDVDEPVPDAPTPTPTDPSSPDFLSDEAVAAQESPDFISDDPGEKYQSTPQQIAGIAESAARGVVPFGGSTWVEKKLGVPAEDIAGRQKAIGPEVDALSEMGGLIASNFIPGGQVKVVGQIAKVVPKLAEFGKLAQMGSGALRGFIANGLIQGGDEISKGLLGEGDPLDHVGASLAHMGAAGLIGSAFGAAGALAERGATKIMDKLSESKLGTKIYSFLAGIGSANNHTPEEMAAMDEAFQHYHDEFSGDFQWYKKGQEFIHDTIGQTLRDFTKTGVEGASTGIGALIGHATPIGGAAGAIGGQQVGKVLSNPLSKLVEKIGTPLVKKYTAPLTVKILSSDGALNLIHTLDHADQMAKGYNAVSGAVDSVFSGGINAAIKEYDAEKERKKLEKYIEDGGATEEIQQQIYQQQAAPTPQGYAEGGDVVPAPAPETPSPIKPVLQGGDGVETHYPEQKMLLTAAKGRVSNYLNSIRPIVDQPKLAFDSAPDLRAQQKSYKRALDIAIKPLSVMDEIRKGTIEPEHIKHLNMMYPEVTGLLQKKVTERITKEQLAGKRPPAKVRQGLSMLMGTALSSEFTPQGIQAAQAVFQKAAQQKQSAGGGKTSVLSKSDDSHLTNTQARTQRQQRAK